jgi:hypothetical protein
MFCCDQCIVYLFNILSFLAVQWMGSAGIARNEIRSVAQSVVDAVYALEENVLGFHDNVDESSASSGTKSAMGRTGSKQQTKTPSASTVGRVNSSHSTASAAGTKRSNTAGSAAVSAPTDNLDDQLNCQQMEQAARACAMMAILEIDPATRLDKCMGAAYFIGRFQTIWSMSIKEAHRAVTFAALSAEAQAATPLEIFELSNEQLGEVDLPNDPLQLLSWKPTPQFLTASKYLADRKPLLVPCALSLPAVPLTCHYVLWLAEAMDKLGFPLYALRCLALLRAVLMFLPNDGVCSGKDAVLASAHFKVLTRCICLKHINCVFAGAKYCREEWSDSFRGYGYSTIPWRFYWVLYSCYRTVIHELSSEAHIHGL